MIVYVISQEGKALMPTKRFGKVRRLLKEGKAKAVRTKPFTIQLLYETKGYTQPLYMGIDPGTKNIGVSVRKESGEVLYLGEIETRSREVAEKMKERSIARRARRRHQREKRKRRAKKTKKIFESKSFRIKGRKEPLVCKEIKPKLVKFQNRKRKKGWLTPTAKHLLESHKEIVKKIKNLLPIEKVKVEYGQFDIQKLENPEIQGKEYQNGRMKGYRNALEYVLSRDKHICQLCEKREGKMEVHHVVWKQEGGQDVPENLVTLCEKCHAKVHKNKKVKAKLAETFTGMEKKYVPATLLNTIMPFFYKWLESQFTEVSKTYGYETKEKRLSQKLTKSHALDAYLVSLDSELVHPKFCDFIPYKFQQFRRHNRQLIYALRDRNYKLGKNIVAKNRNKKTGQLIESLYEFILDKGPSSLSSLKVYPGTKVHRSKFDKFRRGDTVSYQKKRYVVKGYGQMGRSLGFVGEKKYVLAKECKLMTKNTGLVCL
jgi:5-methylcytosine-specific restriction endonuclease McrA